jgi:two-component system cell cycle response regulator
MGAEPAAVDGKTEPGVAPIEAPHVPACLLQIYGGTLGRRYEVDGRSVGVGRDPENAVCIDLTTVSRRHARIYENDGVAWVEDLGSTNGTLVNDVAIDSPRHLANGDQIRIGSSILKFIEGGNVEALYHEEIYRLMITDGLTGAATRRAFLEFLDRELLRAKRHSRPLSLVMLDIDNFREVNDKHGHLAGDHVLRGVAAAVRGEVRGDELFARYGGDEFVVVLPETVRDDAVRICERIRARVAKQKFTWRDDVLPITLSAGGAAARSDDDQAGLLARVDARLYEAKRTGRNRCVLS